jgi:hypothetical protein
MACRTAGRISGPSEILRGCRSFGERLIVERCGKLGLYAGYPHERNFDRVLRDGDVLSIFPPVAGGGEVPPPALEG